MCSYFRAGNRPKYSSAAVKIFLLWRRSLNDGASWKTTGETMFLDDIYASMISMQETWGGYSDIMFQNSSQVCAGGGKVARTCDIVLGFARLN